jgi:RNA polymerase sigma-70 factor (ECF subfamily)
MTNADDDLRASHNVTNQTGAPSTAASDAHLLRRMQMGDAEAWQELYGRYVPSAWRFAWQLVGDRQAAEDIVSESLLALCRKAAALDPETTKLFGWLRGVIRHKAMDHHRAKGRTTTAMDQRANLQQVIESEKQSNHRPSARLEKVEQSNDVLAVLEDLDETKRQCLEWKYVEKLPVREMAARLDLTEKAVESILYRARLEFRERFERREQKHVATSNLFNPKPIEPSNGSST